MHDRHIVHEPLTSLSQQVVLLEQPLPHLGVPPRAAVIKPSNLLGIQRTEKANLVEAFVWLRHRIIRSTRRHRAHCALLRADRWRPPRCRAADEIASAVPQLRSERIAYYASSQGLLRCGILTRLLTGLGQKHPKV